MALGIYISPWILVKPKIYWNEGLHGHLSLLALREVYDYLKQSHAITSAGLLIGLACTKRGIVYI
jgi:hypothetical protein